MEEGVGEATDVPQLGEDLAAFGMYGAGHFLPAIDLRLGEEARGIGVTLRVGADDDGLGDNQADVGAAAVIGSHLLGRHQTWACHAAGERGHHETVGQGQSVIESIRLKQGIHDRLS